MNNENLFFYSTVCHVCKRKRDLKRCMGCKMISYCSVAHQRLNWPAHKTLCRCIQSITKQQMLKSLYANGPSIESRLEWARLRSNAMIMTETWLKRRLLLFEQQMFMFPRVCEICLVQGKNSMLDCEFCYSASYCSAHHLEQHFPIHQKHCKQLRLCFYIDLYFYQDESYPSINFKFEDSYQPLPSNMDGFIKDHIEDNEFDEIKLALVSELITCPLTFIYALEQTQLAQREMLVVHLVGAGPLETTFISLWEGVFHLLPHLKSLHLILIGPEASAAVDDKEQILCRDCRERQHSFKLEFQNDQYYHTYVEDAEYVQPDLILAFNAGLHESEDADEDTWAESLPSLLGSEAPFVLTAYTQQEAKQDLARVQERMDTGLEGEPRNIILKYSKNPFSSLRPYRDWASEESGVFFQNQYISIIK